MDGRPCNVWQYMVLTKGAVTFFYLVLYANWRIKIELLRKVESLLWRESF
jgi:hypothetical protein